MAILLYGFYIRYKNSFANEILVIKDENGWWFLLMLKSPVTGLLLGLFIGYSGADRFYKGDKNLATNKLSYFIVAIAFTILGIYHNSESEITFSFILYLIVSIWCLADILPVFFGIKKDNFEKIMQALDDYENKDINLTLKG